MHLQISDILGYRNHRRNNGIDKKKEVVNALLIFTFFSSIYYLK